MGDATWRLLALASQQWKCKCYDFEKEFEGDLQDGRGVRRGDHLPPHRYIRNTSTCGTTPTEHLLNAGLSPPKSKKLPTYLGSAKEKEKTETKE